MYRGGDSVFRLSLVGIAFILICFLLIVFSRMYSDADVARAEALVRLDQRQQELAQQAFESARESLQNQLSEVGVNPDKVIQDLLDKAKTETELATEKKRVQELGAQLAGLTEVKRVLTQAGRTPVLSGTSIEALASALELRARLEQELLAMPGQNVGKLIDSEIASRTLAAIHFKQNIETLVERELGLPLVPGEEPAWERWLVADSKLFKSTLDGSAANSAGGERSAPRAAGGEASSLRAQVDFLRARLNAHGDKAAPPCWFDDAGRVQFLLTIELHGRPENVTVKPAWPPMRETGARAIPGIQQLLAHSQMPFAAFTDRARSIAQHGGAQCHYSVQVIDNLKSGMRSEKIHRELEAFFHLVDLPR